MSQESGKPADQQAVVEALKAIGAIQSQCAGHADEFSQRVWNLAEQARNTLNAALAWVGPSRLPVAAEQEIGDMQCPWCGDTMNHLKPAGGSLLAEIHGYAWHAACADAYEYLQSLAPGTPAAQPEPEDTRVDREC